MARATRRTKQPRHRPPAGGVGAGSTRSRRREWIRTALGLGAAVLVIFSARSSVADHYRVPSGSMEPNVEIGDRILVNKAAYGLRVPFTSATVAEFAGPARGDVVVLESPVDGTVLLKRVVAVPGDEVLVRGGRLRINGRWRTEASGGGEGWERLGDRRYRVRLTHGGGPDWGPRRLPARRYLVLGDNRGDSQDGRYFGPVERERIRGRAFRIYRRGGSFTWRDL